MKYFFILGSNPTLSAAEISAVFGLSEKKQEIFLNKDVLVIDLENELNAKAIIRRLGGTIKIGQIFDQSAKKEQTILAKLKEYLLKQEFSGKFHFGFSHYGPAKLNGKVLGMETKKFLREQNVSVRWVVSQEKTLSSVVVDTNKLVTSGAEIVLIEFGEKMLIGKTLAVQPFRELSFRDYDRPARDDLSGMLPPKLAQIMINLAVGSAGMDPGRADLNILDPFCGSGTVLSEAALMGFRNIQGSDISQKAIDDSKKNVDWTNQKFKISIQENLKISKINATEIARFVPLNSIDRIITEPYLGPQRGHINVNEVVKELNILYSRSLNDFYKILKPEGKIVMVWPVFVNKRLDVDINKLKIVYPLPEILKRNNVIRLTNRNTIVYGREGQKVWREILILEK